MLLLCACVRVRLCRVLACVRLCGCLVVVAVYVARADAWMPEQEPGLNDTMPGAWKQLHASSAVVSMMFECVVRGLCVYLIFCVSVMVLVVVCAYNVSS